MRMSTVRRIIPIPTIHNVVMDTARHFSRAHSYDQAGRLTSATESPAQFATFPYSQNFSYDAFNNATVPFGNLLLPNAELRQRDLRE
jgi:hypothetical protein